MRKSFIYAFTAAAAMTAAGLAPVTAHAAINTYTIPSGNGKAVIISGSLNGNGLDCGPLFSGIPGFGIPGGGNPGSGIPGVGIPGSQIPGNMLPDPDFSGQGGIMIPDYGTPDSGIPDIENPGGQGNTAPDQEQPDGNQDSVTASVVKLVNEERAKAGLAPLTVDNTITAAAQMRAGEIVTSFSHTRPNGSSFSTALDASGVNYRSAGENIAYGQNSAARVMQDWMNSSGHRANILNGSFTRIGVGHYKSASGVDYWTQLFAN